MQTNAQKIPKKYFVVVVFVVLFFGAVIFSNTLVKMRMIIIRQKVSIPQ